MTTLAVKPPAAHMAVRPVRTAAVLAILLTAQLMAILDVNIVNVAAATIRTDLHASGAALQLIIAGYLIAYAVALITGARTGGLLGPRRVFLWGLAGFTAASLACGLAPGAGSLIVFRFLQGASAAFLIPQVFSLIQRHFTGPARARALGRYGAVIAGGVVAGQILGGVIVSADLFGTGWRPVFWINVPIGLVLLVAGVRILPADDRSPAGARLDIRGLIAFSTAVLAFVVPLIFGHETGWPLWTWVSLAASAALFVAFAAVQRRVAAPLIPGRVLRSPGMLPALGTMFLMMAAYGGYLFSVALHLQAGLGYSPARAGLTFVPMAASFAIASLNWRRVPARWHGSMIPAGLLVAAASLGVIALALRGGAVPGPLFYAAQVPFGLGSGLAYAPTMGRALAGVQPADAADASGLVTTTVQLAQVVGLAGVGSVYLTLVAAHGSATAVAATALAGSLVVLAAAGCALMLPRTS